MKDSYNCLGIFQSQPVESNSGAICWGTNGLVAVGMKRSVIIVDCRSLQILHSLEASTIVTSIAWCKNTLPADLSEEPFEGIISGDEKGRIIVWKLVSDKRHCTFDSTNVDVRSCFVYPGNDNKDFGQINLGSVDKLIIHPTKKNLFYSFHKEHALCLWDYEAKQIVWSLYLPSFPEDIVAATVNETDGKIALVGNKDGLYIISDEVPQSSAIFMQSHPNINNVNQLTKRPVMVCPPMTVTSISSAPISVEFLPNIHSTVLIVYPTQVVLFDYTIAMPLQIFQFSPTFLSKSSSPISVNIFSQKPTVALNPSWTKDEESFAELVRESVTASAISGASSSFIKEDEEGNEDVENVNVGTSFSSYVSSSPSSSTLTSPLSNSSLSFLSSYTVLPKPRLVTPYITVATILFRNGIHSLFTISPDAILHLFSSDLSRLIKAQQEQSFTIYSGTHSPFTPALYTCLTSHGKICLVEICTKKGSKSSEKKDKIDGAASTLTLVAPSASRIPVPSSPHPSHPPPPPPPPPSNTSPTTSSLVSSPSNTQNKKPLSQTNSSNNISSPPSTPVSCSVSPSDTVSSYPSSSIASSSSSSSSNSNSSSFNNYNKYKVFSHNSSTKKRVLQLLHGSVNKKRRLHNKQNNNNNNNNNNNDNDNNNNNRITVPHRSAGEAANDLIFSSSPSPAIAPLSEEESREEFLQQISPLPAPLYSPRNPPVSSNLQVILRCCMRPAPPLVLSFEPFPFALSKENAHYLLPALKVEGEGEGNVVNGPSLMKGDKKMYCGSQLFFNGHPEHADMPSEVTSDELLSLQYLIAYGTKEGYVGLYDLLRRRILLEVSVSSYSIRCVRWITPSVVIAVVNKSVPASSSQTTPHRTTSVSGGGGGGQGGSGAGDRGRSGRGRGQPLSKEAVLAQSDIIFVDFRSGNLLPLPRHLVSASSSTGGSISGGSVGGSGVGGSSGSVGGSGSKSGGGVGGGAGSGAGKSNSNTQLPPPYVIRLSPSRRFLLLVSSIGLEVWEIPTRRLIRIFSLKSFPPLCSFTWRYGEEGNTPFTLSNTFFWKTMLSNPTRSSGGVGGSGGGVGISRIGSVAGLFSSNSPSGKGVKKTGDKMGDKINERKIIQENNYLQKFYSEEPMMSFDVKEHFMAISQFGKAFLFEVTSSSLATLLEEKRKEFESVELSQVSVTNVVPSSTSPQNKPAVNRSPFAKRSFSTIVTPSHSFTSSAASLFLPARNPQPVLPKPVKPRVPPPARPPPQPSPEKVGGGGGGQTQQSSSTTTSSTTTPTTSTTTPTTSTTTSSSSSSSSDNVEDFPELPSGCFESSTPSSPPPSSSFDFSLNPPTELATCEQISSFQLINSTEKQINPYSWQGDIVYTVDSNDILNIIPIYDRGRATKVYLNQNYSVNTVYGNVIAAPAPRVASGNSQSLDNSSTYSFPLKFNRMQFSSDRKMVCLLSNDGSALVWSMSGSELISRSLSRMGIRVNDIMWMRDNSLLVVDNTNILWCVNPHMDIPRINNTGIISSLIAQESILSSSLSSSSLIDEKKDIKNKDDNIIKNEKMEIQKEKEKLEFLDSRKVNEGIKGADVFDTSFGRLRQKDVGDRLLSSALFPLNARLWLRDICFCLEVKDEAIPLLIDGYTTTTTTTTSSSSSSSSVKNNIKKKERKKNKNNNEFYPSPFDSGVNNDKEEDTETQFLWKEPASALDYFEKYAKIKISSTQHAKMLLSLHPLHFSTLFRQEAQAQYIEGIFNIPSIKTLKEWIKNNQDKNESDMNSLNNDNSWGVKVTYIEDLEEEDEEEDEDLIELDNKNKEGSSSSSSSSSTSTTTSSSSSTSTTTNTTTSTKKKEWTSNEVLHRLRRLEMLCMKGLIVSHIFNDTLSRKYFWILIFYYFSRAILSHTIPSIVHSEDKKMIDSKEKIIIRNYAHIIDIMLDELIGFLPTPLTMFRSSSHIRQDAEQLCLRALLAVNTHLLNMKKQFTRSSTIQGSDSSSSTKDEFVPPSPHSLSSTSSYILTGSSSPSIHAGMKRSNTSTTITPINVPNSPKHSTRASLSSYYSALTNFSNTVPSVQGDVRLYLPLSLTLLEPDTSIVNSTNYSVAASIIHMNAVSPSFFSKYIIERFIRLFLLTGRFLPVIALLFNTPQSSPLHLKNLKRAEILLNSLTHRVFLNKERTFSYISDGDSASNSDSLLAFHKITFFALSFLQSKRAHFSFCHQPSLQSFAASLVTAADPPSLMKLFSLSKIFLVHQNPNSKKSDQIIRKGFSSAATAAGAALGALGLGNTSSNKSDLTIATASYNNPTVYPLLSSFNVVPPSQNNQTQSSSSQTANAFPVIFSPYDDMHRKLVQSEQTVWRAAESLMAEGNVAESFLYLWRHGLYAQALMSVKHNREGFPKDYLKCIKFWAVSLLEAAGMEKSALDDVLLSSPRLSMLGIFKCPIKQRNLSDFTLKSGFFYSTHSSVQLTIDVKQNPLSDGDLLNEMTQKVLGNPASIPATQIASPPPVTSSSSGSFLTAAPRNIFHSPLVLSSNSPRSSPQPPTLLSKLHSSSQVRSCRDTYIEHHGMKEAASMMGAHSEWLWTQLGRNENVKGMDTNGTAYSVNLSSADFALVSANEQKIKSSSTYLPLSGAALSCSMLLGEALPYYYNVPLSFILDELNSPPRSPMASLSSDLCEDAILVLLSLLDVTSIMRVFIQLRDFARCRLFIEAAMCADLINEEMLNKNPELLPYCDMIFARTDNLVGDEDEDNNNK